VNVVHYTHAGGSGAARYVANLSRALATRGAAVDLLCPKDFIYSDEVSRSGVRVIHGPTSLAGARGRMAKLGRAVWQSVNGAWIASRPPNRSRLVHVNFIGIPALGLPVIAYLRLRGRRVILTVHDVRPHHPLLGPRLWPVERLFLRALYLAANHLVVHYQPAARQLGRDFGIPAARVTVIPHGADLRVEAAPARSATDPTVRLALLGSLRENKGVHLAIGAVQEVRRRGLPVELTIAGLPGASDAGYWAMCQAMIEAAPEGFHITPSFLSDADMRSRLIESDAVILPYDSFAAQSGVAIDAIATGRAIITTPAGGLDELLVQSGAGIRIEHAAHEAVRDAIEKAVGLGHSGLAALGAAGAKYAREQLDWPRVADRHLSLYRQLIAR
jgi:glycosyltransferase involved in cell wall biosynthesis